MGQRWNGQLARFPREAMNARDPAGGWAHGWREEQHLLPGTWSGPSLHNCTLAGDGGCCGARASGSPNVPFFDEPIRAASARAAAPGSAGGRRATVLLLWEQG